MSENSSSQKIKNQNICFYSSWPWNNYFTSKDSYFFLHSIKILL